MTAVGRVVGTLGLGAVGLVVEGGAALFDELSGLAVGRGVPECMGILWSETR